MAGSVASRAESVPGRRRRMVRGGCREAVLKNGLQSNQLACGGRRVRSEAACGRNHVRKHIARGRSRVRRYVASGRNRARGNGACAAGAVHGERTAMLDDEVHFLLMRAFNSSNRAVVERTGAMGLLPGQPKVLEYLSEHDGSRATDICAGCVLDKSTMTSLLSRMETAGLIERRPQRDRRQGIDGMADRARRRNRAPHARVHRRGRRRGDGGVGEGGLPAARRAAAQGRPSPFDRCKTSRGPERPAS